MPIGKKEMHNSFNVIIEFGHSNFSETIRLLNVHMLFYIFILTINKSKIASACLKTYLC